MSLTIRPARPDDGATVFSLVRALADYEKLAHEVDATPEMIASALFGDRPTAFCDLAEWDGAPVGFALWFLNFSSFRGRNGIYLEDIFVQPGYRGKGIGKAFFGHLAGVAAREGARRLAWTVLDWNTPAIKFYQGMGATPNDGWTEYRLQGEALKAMAGT